MTTAKANAKKIILVDDHPVLRKGLVRLIDAKDEFVVCGEASTAADAMELIRELKPDLVIVDIGPEAGREGGEQGRACRLRAGRRLQRAGRTLHSDLAKMER